MEFPQPPDEFSAEASLTEQARETADRLVRATAEARDLTRAWDPALFTGLAAARPGLAGPLVPRHLGGGGLTATQTCALLEGLGEGSRDPGLSLVAATHAVLVALPLRVFGTAAQQRSHLRGGASGERLSALSLRQTQGAALTPTVTVRAAPDGWALDGELDLVVGAGAARHFLIVAAHPDGSGRSAFLVDRDTAGLRVEESRPNALRTCPWGRLVLENCRVPYDAVLGTPHGAAAEVEPLVAALNWVFTSAPWLGVMRALTRDAADRIRELRLFDRPLHHFQSARLALADMATQCELVAGPLHRAAAQFDSGGQPTQQDAAATRLLVTDAARTVVEAAARLAGPADRTDDGLIERAHRDLLFVSTVGGGAEVLRPVVAAAELGLG